VLFGENVPRPRVERCYAAVDALDPATEPLVVLGSSLSVMSGFRFVRRAVARGVTVVVVTRGPTRADPLTGTGLVHTLHHGTTEFLTALEQLGRSTTGRRQRSRSEPLR
jgi:NAD-dependent SIR2 family protein deacetylase